VAFENNQMFELISKLSDYYASSVLFISADANKYVIKIRKNLMQLWNIIKNEVISDEYKKYPKEQIIDLMRRANNVINLLIEDRDCLARQMNKELNPSEVSNLGWFRRLFK
jgi:hypothetical protein